MKIKDLNKLNFYSSKEAKTVLKIQDCDLMHLRTSGKLKFMKKGNAYLYSKESIIEFNNKKLSIK